MDVRVGDILIMKKPHPCGCNRMIVLRSGADFKLSCEKCERMFMSPRSNIEKSIKKIERNETQTN